MTAQHIVPGTDRIVAGIRLALARLQEDETLSRAGRGALAAVDALLIELEQRQRPETYRALYRDGLALLRAEGAAATDLPDPDGLSFEALSRQIACVAEAMSALMEARVGTGGAIVPAFLDWEERLYQTRAPTPPQAVPQESPHLTFEALAAYLAGRGFRLVAIDMAVGGFQNDTAFLTVEDEAGARHEWVLRADKADRFVRLDAGSVVEEHGILQVARAHGIPIAPPVLVEPDKGPIGNAFLISERIAGTVHDDASTASEEEMRSIVETLADIHRLIPAEALAGTAVGHWLDHQTLADNSRAAVESWRTQRWADAVMASPTATAYLSWLAANVPATIGRPVLIHGDYGPHNVMVEGGRLVAVLDWEAARLGDPADDVAYLLTRIGEGSDRERIVGWYEARAGHKLSRESLRFFEIYNRFKVVICTAYAAALFDRDETAAVQWCQLGLPLHYYGLMMAKGAASSLLVPHPQESP